MIAGMCRDAICVLMRVMQLLDNAIEYVCYQM